MMYVQRVAEILPILRTDLAIKKSPMPQPKREISAKIKAIDIESAASNAATTFGQIT